MNKIKKTNIKIIPARTFKIGKGGKYLVIMPKDAQIDKIAPALSDFFKPVPVFILAVNDVSEIRITELVEEMEENAKEKEK